MNDIDPVWTYEPTEEIAELRALLFDAIETGRRWETIARQQRMWINSARNADRWETIEAAFRDLADRTPTPTDGT